MDELMQKLKMYNQLHLLNFYEKLSEEQNQELLRDIESIDFEKMQKLFEEKDFHISKDVKISCAPYIDKVSLSAKEKEKYEQLGDELIKQNKLAVCSMAGGQGTRLGHTGPKGTYIVDLEEPKSIFEILIDKLKAVYRKYGVYINWYIMTSNANDKQTKDFFEKNNYFDYPKDCIIFFEQGELPLMDFNGKIILKNEYSIYKAADGNGGVFEALYRNKVLEDMKNKGIEYLSIGNVDNILIKQVDNLFMGMIKEGNYDLASKSVVKRSPDEPVGVFCKINNRPSVIEYIDLDKTLAEERNENGELVYGEAFFGNSLVSRKLLEKIGREKLPYHGAKKKNSYLDENGNLVTSEVPNTYKFEAFIFDGFKVADDMLILRTKREEEFAPIKNKEGNDSPQTAKELYTNYMSNK